METAAIIAKKAKSIVVIGMETVPFERVLGEKIGIHLQKVMIEICETLFLVAREEWN